MKVGVAVPATFLFRLALSSTSIAGQTLGERPCPVAGGGTIAGIVLDDSTGVPVQARVAAWPPCDARTGADGRFIIASLRAGTYTVTAASPAYRELFAPPSVTVTVGDTAYLELRLRRPIVNCTLLPECASMCYEVLLGEWQQFLGTTAPAWPAEPPPPLDPAAPRSLDHTLPPRIGLGADSVRGGLQLVVPPDWHVQHRIRSWRQQGDSMFVALSTGFTGTQARFARAGTAWRGWRRLFSDAGVPPPNFQPVELIPTPCSPVQ
jgi:hypothetical protein